MPNPGIKTLLGWLPRLRSLAARHAIELRVSIAGFSPEEYAELAGVLIRCGVDDVELNFGCPNVWGPDGKQKPIPSYEPELVSEILLKVRAAIPTVAKVSVKLSPVEDAEVLLRLARRISETNIVSRVIAVNTLPNQNRTHEEGGPALSFNGGNHLGGLSGRPLKEHGLRVVKTLRGALPLHIDVIGAGGVFNGSDMLDYLNAGASGVMIATALLEFGPRIFSSVLQEFAELLGAEKYLGDSS